MKRFASVLLIAVLTTLVAQPSYSDDITINLDQTTPYVDVPVTVVDPVDATVSTTTGLSNTGTWIDSWIELWQGTTRLIYNDDGNHSNTNVLASIFTIPLQAGEYFIRATSWNYIASNGANFPVGSYLLSTNLVVATPSPSPTQTSSSPTPEPTPEPSSPSPSPTDTPQPSESPTVPVVPTQEPNVPDPEPSVELILPSELPIPDVPDTLEEVVDSSFNDFPSSLENDLPSVLEPVDLPVEDVSSIDEILNLLSFLPELSLENLQETFQQISETITAAFESVPGGEQVLAAAEFVGEQFTAAAEFATNLGTEFTPEERQQAQQVVLGAVIVTQLSTARRIK
jgi:hypothetical protein